MSTTYPASPKQVAFLTSLAGELGDHPAGAQVRADLATGLNSRQASALIDLALQARKEQRLVARTAPAAVAAAQADPAQAPVSQPGMYRTEDGRMFKVQRARESGNLYAKELTRIGGRRLTEEGQVVGYEFQYAPGAIAQLREAHRMTLEQAKAWGIEFGCCCVCGAFLKDATSVALGIGPVCGKRV